MRKVKRHWPYSVVILLAFVFLTIFLDKNGIGSPSVISQRNSNFLLAQAIAKLLPIVRDDFEKYVNGSIAGQGNWKSYVNGQNFVVQGNVTLKSRKALYNNSFGDSVATKAGTPLASGKQIIHVRTENRFNWGPYADGNAQVRVSKGSWASGAPGLPFTAISFKSDGNVAYFNPLNDVYQNFATYTDNKWTTLEIEWRSIDKKARYKIDKKQQTDWVDFANSNNFTDFDHIGFDFILPSGSGGVYFDNIR